MTLLPMLQIGLHNLQPIFTKRAMRLMAVIHPVWLKTQSQNILNTS